MNLAALIADPAAWAALITLIVMEVVLGIDNLIFISILSNKLPEGQRQKVRRVGISLALLCHHASVLVDAGVVTKRKEGQTSYWTLNRESLSASFAALGDQG